jgi:hypothetical protein
MRSFSAAESTSTALATSSGVSVPRLSAALLFGINGEYNYQSCGHAHFFWESTEITPDAFHEFVSTGASDEKVGDWLREHSRARRRRSRSTSGMFP